MNSFTLDIDVTYETQDGLEFPTRLYAEVTKATDFFAARAQAIGRFEQARHVEVTDYSVANQSDYNDWLRS